MKPSHSARLALLFAGSLVSCAGTEELGDTPARSSDVVTEAISSNGVTANINSQSDWGSGYCVGVTLANGSTTAVTNWTVVIDLGGSTLSNLWSASYTQSGGTVTASPLSWNANIAPNGSTAFGFCGSGTGRPTLSSLTVTGGSNTTTQYTLTIAASAGGTTNPAVGTYKYDAGTAVKVTATAASGYTFESWSGAATGTTNPVTVTMDGNKTLTANFKQGGTQTYTLAIGVSGNGTTNPTPGTYTYNANASATVTATPASGATFTGWSGAATGTANPVTVTMDANKTLTATFSGGNDSGKSAGCGKSRTLQNGTITIQSGGTSRSYILRVPDNYDNTHPYRLIVAYHWLGGTAQDVVNSYNWYGLWSLANNSTIFVAPQGLSSGGSTGWPNTNGQDLAFTDAFIAQVEGDLCVDTTRIFANGFSYGAGMSYEIACARANVFRGVALYSGAQLSGCDGGTTPIAYFQAHGVNDSVLPISGARSLRDHFVSVNGCTPQNPTDPASGSGKHTCTAYQGCSAGHPLTWCAFDGDHNPSPRDSGQSTSWVPQQVWDFINQF